MMMEIDLAGVAGAFTAGQIATSVLGATSVQFTEAPQDARARLLGTRFDQAPVCDDANRLVGWVHTDALARGRCQAVEATGD